MADHNNQTPNDNPTAYLDNPATLFMVYLVIAVGCILTIAVSMAGLGDKALYLHLAIATVQVSLLGYYFMHLKRADSLTWLTALSGIFFMAILFALPFGDIVTRHLGSL